MRVRIGRLIDRRIAVSCFLLVIVVLVPVAAASETAAPPATPAPAAAGDPAAAEDLVALLRAGEKVDVVLEHTFTRTRPDDGRSLSSPLTEVRYGDASLSHANDALTIQLPKVVYTCQRVDDAASCYKRNERAPVRLWQLVRTAVDAGAYEVARGPSVDVAGERAECFIVQSRVNGELPGLGRALTTCLAADGVPLRTQIEAATSTDSWHAADVRRNIDRSALTEALPGFEQAVSLLPG